MKKNAKIRILSVISIILLCISTTIKTFQNDTFYIIKLGEDIMKYGIDLIDHHCWITNLPYTYPHWLYDILIYWIYHQFGNIGIYISTICFFIILILTIYIIQLKLNKNEFMALFASIISIVCLYGFATARAQLITTTLFLLEVYFLIKLIENGNNKYIIYLTIISLLVANLHATIWLFYFILYLPFIGEFVGYKITQSKYYKCKKNNHSKIIIENIPYIKKILLSLILGLFMGLFTPSRICYTYIFRIMLGDSQLYIMEHAPLTIIQHPCFIALLLVLLAILIFSNIKIYLRELLMIGGITLMSLVSTRHLAFFYTINMLYISRLCIRYLKLKQDKTLDTLTNIITKNKMIYLLILLVVISGSYYKFNKNDKLDYIDKKSYPTEAVKYIKKNINVKNMRLYNDYNYGSYLLFQDIPVFIDSRCDLYLKEFNHLNYSIFDDDMKMEYNYEQKFKFYKVTHVLVERREIFYQILKNNKNYKLIYKDKNFVLFERI